MCLVPFGVFADTGNTLTGATVSIASSGTAQTLDADSMVTQMTTIINQYGNRIKALEQENAILRNEIMKAGIQIPLSAYS